MSGDGKSIHASAVLVGDRAVLVRGPSGSGKSRLVFDLILVGLSRLLLPWTRVDRRASRLSRRAAMKAVTGA